MSHQLILVIQTKYQTILKTKYKTNKSIKRYSKPKVKQTQYQAILKTKHKTNKSIKRYSKPKVKQTKYQTILETKHKTNKSIKRYSKLTKPVTGTRTGYNPSINHHIHPNSSGYFCQITAV